MGSLVLKSVASVGSWMRNFRFRLPRWGRSRLIADPGRSGLIANHGRSGLIANHGRSGLIADPGRSGLISLQKYKGIHIYIYK